MVALAYNSRAGGRFNAACTLLDILNYYYVWNQRDNQQ